MSAVTKTEQRVGAIRQTTWPPAVPFEWSCPWCGSRYLITALSPQCATCGFLET